MKWITECVNDNKNEGKTAPVIPGLLHLLNNKMPSNETRSITQWEKANPRAMETCAREAGRRASDTASANMDAAQIRYFLALCAEGNFPRGMRCATKEVREMPNTTVSAYDGVLPSKRSNNGVTDDAIRMR